MMMLLYTVGQKVSHHRFSLIRYCATVYSIHYLTLESSTYDLSTFCCLLINICKNTIICFRGVVLLISWDKKMPGLTFCPTSHEVISSCVHRGAIRHQRPPPIIWAKLSDRHYRDPKPRFVNTRYFFQWRPYGCLHFIVLRLPVYFFSWKCKLSLVHALLLLLDYTRLCRDIGS